ncbi:MAG: class I SAM-dependent methyltransferase family protein [Candidatus Thermoplasmatota archaeon]
MKIKLKGVCVPSSYDIIGSIAILKFSSELLENKEEICNSIFKINKNVRTIAFDKGVKGIHRTRELEVLAGVDSLITKHKEFGMVLSMDLRKVYFSPRLATERKRIVDLVNDGETIIDMFAGIGSFSVLIAKNKKPKKIYAIDINPDAFFYLNENIRLNRISNIVPMLGDAKAILEEMRKKGFGGADRIIMNLPFSGNEFLQTAISTLKENGMIHYYEILEDGKIYDRVKEIEREYNVRIVNIRNVKCYSPNKIHVGFDILGGKDVHNS